MKLLNEPVLFWIRKGSVKLLNGDMAPLELLDETGCFGSLLKGVPSDAKLELTEDALLYSLDATQIETLAANHPEIQQFIQQSAARYLHHIQPVSQDSILQRRCLHLVKREPISVSPDATVQQAANLMTQQRISSLPVTKGTRLLGLLTDRDLRSRVLAKGLSCSTRVEEVMTKDVATIDSNCDLMDAQLLMATKRIHHLPVLEQHRLRGMLTSTDLIDLQRNSPIFLTGELSRQTDLEGLISVSQRLPQLFCHLMDCHINATRLGQLLAAAVDVLTQRLLVIAESRFGPPPFSYCWITLGAHAREELTLASDQDSALILAQHPDEAEDNYFQAVADFVCEGLNACGIKTCPGNIMASNPELRLSLSDWRVRFTRWIESPTPKALLQASIFFDMRAVAGEIGLSDLLVHKIREQASGNQLFLAALSRAACDTRPPLSFFGRLRVEKQQNGKRAIDLKASALSMLVDISRIYALAENRPYVNTTKRLTSKNNSTLLSKEDSRNLIQAFSFLATLRYRGHQHCILGKQPIDHMLAPDTLDALTRHQLKEAMVLIANAQKALLLKFSGGR